MSASAYDGAISRVVRDVTTTTNADAVTAVSAAGPGRRTVLRFGYGTNGFADHRFEDVVTVLEGLGYNGVALTLDHQHLDPFDADLARQVDRVRDRLTTAGLAVVIETGARYLLDPWHKHSPTLVSPQDRGRRLELLRRAVRVGADLGAEAVSFWSGAVPAGVPSELAWDLLVDGCATVVEAAQEAGVQLGFEPEPGMMIEDLDGYERLRDLLGAPTAFGLTLDIGHCRCLEPAPVPDCVRRSADWVVNVQIEDMRRGVHEHLEFGLGEIDFPPVLDSLIEIGYRGLVSVELPRHSHAAPDVARRSLAFLHYAGAPARSMSGRASASSSSSSSSPAGVPCEPSVNDVASALAAALPASGHAWLVAAVDTVRASPTEIRRLFPAARRHCGRGQPGKQGLHAQPYPMNGPLRPALADWTSDDAARALLLTALPMADEALAAEAARLYEQGDAAERRAVLLALPLLDIGSAALAIVRDALRTNDTRLIGAAVGPYAARYLDDASWRQAVLKCVFVGVPVAVVADLAGRADEELARMLVAFAHERVAAGRDVPADIWSVVDRFPDLRLPELAAQSGPHRGSGYP